MDRKRIDAVFLAEQVFKNELQKQGYYADDVEEIVQSCRPFGIYICKSRLSPPPDFTTKLNQKVPKMKAKPAFQHSVP